jgi:hypothetical protein
MSHFTKLFIIFMMLIRIVPAVSDDGTSSPKGKDFKLTRKQGPWMIMVAAITNVDEERRIKGMSASQAADQLVQELRKKKLAAYIYEMNETITVFVGDYRSNNDEALKKDLKYIKEGFKPKFLMDEKNGGLFAKTPGRPGPLSKAFVTVNPLLSPEEVKQKSFDKEAMKLTMALNSDGDYSLLKSKGRYTLIIATFHGNSIMQVGNRTDAKAMARFEKSFGSNLDQTGEEAWALTQALREAKKAGYDENYEAWVFHDRHKSVVTIGSFNDPNDPKIQTLATQFRAKPGRHPQTGEDMMTPETFTVPRRPAPGRLADRMWIFDGTPRLMEVPRMK